MSTPVTPSSAQQTGDMRKRYHRLIVHVYAFCVLTCPLTMRDSRSARSRKGSSTGITVGSKVAGADGIREDQVFRGGQSHSLDFSICACAAATLAMGMRKGEQLTWSISLDAKSCTDLGSPQCHPQAPICRKGQEEGPTRSGDGQVAVNCIGW